MTDTRKEDLSKSLERFKTVIEAAKEKARKLEEEKTKRRGGES